MRCSMPHASDWLLAPPIAGLGLALLSTQFRTALMFRLGFALFSEPFACPALSAAGKACGEEMDRFGDQARWYCTVMFSGFSLDPSIWTLRSGVLLLGNRREPGSP